jgi:dUTP pyrophosphatase
MGYNSYMSITKGQWEMMKAKTLKFKKLNEKAVIPVRAHPSDAGFDITATAIEKDVTTGVITYSTGIAVELPIGTAGFLMPRSSIFRTNLSLCNSVGLLDQNFRGELKFKFRPTDYSPKIYEVGERIGQLVVIDLPLLLSEEVNELSNTDRGVGGFGSSGA